LLGLILARGGSIGILRQNIRELGDKPLFAYVVQATKPSQYGACPIDLDGVGIEGMEAKP
jgi:CMP-N-acetylneuraminic acid synthetase